MSTPSPASPTPPQRSPDRATWKPSRRALLWVLLAFVAGLVAFALVWNHGRGTLYRAAPVPPTASGPGYAPLPAPLPAGSGNASGLEAAAPAPDSQQERPRLVETPRPPLPIAVRPLGPAAPSSLPPTAATPIAGQTPAPRYPPSALRRGERGTVIVRAEIGADGVPISVGVDRTSGSRDLDRAAVAAVKNWRFQPLRIPGPAAPRKVRVPIDFNPD